MILQPTGTVRAGARERRGRPELAPLAPFLLGTSWIGVLSHELGGPIAVLRGYASLWASGDLPNEAQELALESLGDTELLSVSLDRLLEAFRFASASESARLTDAVREFEGEGRPAAERLRSKLFAWSAPGDREDLFSWSLRVCRAQALFLSGLMAQLALAAGLREESALLATSLELTRWVREMVHALAPALAITGHRTVLGMPGRSLRVTAAPSVLAIALINLLDNAQRFAPAGTDIQVRVLDLGRAAGFEVSDRGPGMPSGFSPGPFTRLERDLALNLPGLGLGLMLTERAARLHGGALEYRPRSGGGSSFRVIMPLE